MTLQINCIATRRNCILSPAFSLALSLSIANGTNIPATSNDFTSIRILYLPDLLCLFRMPKNVLCVHVSSWMMWRSDFTIGDARNLMRLKIYFIENDCVCVLFVNDSKLNWAIKCFLYICCTWTFLNLAVDSNEICIWMLLCYASCACSLNLTLLSTYFRCAHTLTIYVSHLQR